MIFRRDRIDWAKRKGRSCREGKIKNATSACSDNWSRPRDRSEAALQLSPVVDGRKPTPPNPGKWNDQLWPGRRLGLLRRCRADAGPRRGRTGESEDLVFTYRLSLSNPQPQPRRSGALSWHRPARCLSVAEHASVIDAGNGFGFSQPEAAEKNHQEGDEVQRGKDPSGDPRSSRRPAWTEPAEPEPETTHRSRRTGGREAVGRRAHLEVSSQLRECGDRQSPRPAA